MEETREALVQKLLDIYSKEGNYETSVPGVWVHRSERNKVPKPHIYQPNDDFYPVWYETHQIRFSGENLQSSRLFFDGSYGPGD